MDKVIVRSISCSQLRLILTLSRDNVGEAKHGIRVGRRTNGAGLFGREVDVGVPRWGRYFRDGTTDPQLTPLGEQQAQEAHGAWKTERLFGIPLPEKLYTSPLTRAIRTHQVTFGDTPFPSGLKTIILENMREHNGVHTCDKRRTRSDIQAAFPEYGFEEGFTENDQLWKANSRETYEDIDVRARCVLDKIFQNDREQCGLSFCFSRWNSVLKLTRGRISYISHSTWWLHQLLLASVSSSALDFTHRRFVPVLKR
ncbi:histidine phosphatase superfamily [Boletus reticuloceps]|uniref:Histidine phosphatase superfamily n=1 Tax=Boletus reticuloceps TaxID=495285 RepID=A0A8I3A2K3_9AGAM|nr:histidine phosphatase superfamily [Boletus reticuloceps]